MIPRISSKQDEKSDPQGTIINSSNDIKHFRNITQKSKRIVREFHSIMSPVIKWCFIIVAKDISSPYFLLFSSPPFHLSLSLSSIPPTNPNRQLVYRVYPNTVYPSSYVPRILDILRQRFALSHRTSCNLAWTLLESIDDAWIKFANRNSPLLD